MVYKVQLGFGLITVDCVQSPSDLLTRHKIMLGRVCVPLTVVLLATSLSVCVSDDVTTETSLDIAAVNSSDDGKI